MAAACRSFRPPSVPRKSSAATDWPPITSRRTGARTEANARGQCGKPYVIGAGPSGGVMMHLADQPQLQELRLKGAPGGKTFIGPAGEPPGGRQDREVLSFDGRVMVTRYVDPEVDTRYGTSVYVRCGARAA